MGLISFIKEAGANIFGSNKTAEEKAIESSAGVLAEKEATEVEASNRIQETITDLNLQVTDLKVVIDDDKATVTGMASDQATKEKVVLVVGNSKGIATVEDNMTVNDPTPEAKFYTVVSGDSLSKIAKVFYGNAMKYPEIFEANKPMLTDPNKIYPGQVLRIPALD